MTSGTIDYGKVNGYFVRIDVQIPKDARYPSRDQSDELSGWLGLTPEEADEFAARLTEMARRALAAQSASPRGDDEHRL